MEPARGSMTASRLFNVNDLGLGTPGPTLIELSRSFSRSARP
jgi:hypothetical protein